MRQLLVGVMVAMLMAGASAAERGTMFDISLADTFQVGATTIDEAKERLGNPVSVTTDANGSQLLWWKYARVGAFTGRTVRKLAIVFDKDGKMLRIAHREALD